MVSRWKVLVTTVALVSCMLALAACGSSGGSSTASSSAAPSSSAPASSTAPSASSSSAPGAGANAIIALDYNAGTGFEWTYAADPEGIVTLADQKTESLSADKTASGGPLQERFTFTAKAPGEVVLTFKLARSWESGEPAETQLYAFTVTEDLRMILNPYKSDFNNEPVIE